MTLIVKKEQERSICRGGNSPLLYLPKEYFTPGEKVGSQLEIDPDGNLRMVLTKKLFNFTCNDIKTLADDFNVEYDKTVAGTRIFSATKEKMSLSCTKSTRDLEPTFVSVSELFDQIQTPKDHAKLTSFVETLRRKGVDAYIEPEGNLDAIRIYKDPQEFNLKNEQEAIEALHETGKKIDFSVVARFNSQKNTAQEIKATIEELKTKDQAHL